MKNRVRIGLAGKNQVFCFGHIKFEVPNVVLATYLVDLSVKENVGPLLISYELQNGDHGAYK